MKDKLNLSLIITIGTILLSVGGSFAVTKAKVDSLEKSSEKTEKVIKEVYDFKVEQRVVNDVIKEKLDENKETMREILKVLQRDIR